MKTRVSDFRDGDRVQLHPGCDLWMMGARYGDVIKLGRTRVHVILDRYPTRIIKLDPNHLTLVD